MGAGVHDGTSSERTHQTSKPKRPREPPILSTRHNLRPYVVGGPYAV